MAFRKFWDHPQWVVPRVVVPRRQDIAQHVSFLATWVANHRAGFGSSCLLTELAMWLIDQTRGQDN